MINRYDRKAIIRSRIVPGLIGVQNTKEVQTASVITDAYVRLIEIQKGDCREYITCPADYAVVLIDSEVVLFQTTKEGCVIEMRDLPTWDIVACFNLGADAAIVPIQYTPDTVAYMTMGVIYVLYKIDGLYSVKRCNEELAVKLNILKQFKSTQK